MSISLPKYSDGILLRDFKKDDAEHLAKIEYDPEVKKYLSIPSKQRNEWIQEFSPAIMTGCVVVALPEQMISGHTSITRTEFPGKGELRIVIAKNFWGRGLGKKAAKLMITAAFEELHAQSVIATVHPENRASLHLIKSLGFIFCRTKEADFNHWQFGHLIYELTV